MAISTYKCFLMSKGASGSAYTKLVDIKDFPDLGGSPELLETTTLSDKAQTYILGIQSVDSLEFTCNYTVEDFQKIEALKETETEFAVWFGGTESGGSVTPDGSNGKFSFKGYASASVTGGGVNEVVEMKVTIAPSTPLEFSAT